jgi:hypothetical protein
MNVGVSSLGGKTRTLTRDEVKSLRDTKREITAHVLREFAIPDKC